jgi:signal transduction histidine kinase
MPPEQIARLAAEQEAALRALLLTGPGGTSRAADQAGSAPPARRLRTRPAPATEPDTADLAEAVDHALHACLPATRTSFSRPAGPLLLPAAATRELAAAVRAALDNVVRHAGPDARVFVLLEDETGAVRVTVRDDGVGMAPGRPQDAVAEGRLGISRSIRGRVEDLGGTVTVASAPGEGTEVVICVRR